MGTGFRAFQRSDTHDLDVGLAFRKGFWCEESADVQLVGFERNDDIHYS